MVDTNNNGITVKEYITTILEERERVNQRYWASLEKYLATTKEEFSKDLDHAVEAAAQERKHIIDSIKVLESGGAPFASRLDSDITRMKEDVDKLKVESVRNEVIEALRKKNEEEVKVQKRRTFVAIGSAGLALFVIVIEGILRIVTPS